MSNLMKLLTAGGAAAEGAAAEGVDFDGASDYMLRSSDFTGNSNGTAFTLSFWVYVPNDASASGVYALGSSWFNVQVYNNGLVVDAYYNSVQVMRINRVAGTLDLTNTWHHFLVSVDTSSTSTRHAYIDDKVDPSTSWQVYIVGSPLQFVNTSWYVGSNSSSSALSKGRLAHMFLDYTYRDLSIEANRRLFITEDGKPAEGQASLNPIMYLPMKDADTWYVNEGTGGDYTPNGTIAVSGRGPNQDNCVASYFDGSDDSLTKTLTFNSDEIVFSCVHKAVGTSSEITAENSGANDSYLVYVNTSNIQVKILDSSSTQIFDGTLSGNYVGQTLHISCSFKASTSAKVVIINGVDRTDDFAWTLSSTNAVQITKLLIAAHTSFFKSQVNGEFYLDDAYINLAVNNPFWCEDSNLPKPVRQVVSETAVTPLIAAPIAANNPVENIGSLGDFTLNGGPLVGSRGASEFWARSVGGWLNGNYLVPSLTGASASKTCSLVTFVNRVDGSELWNLTLRAGSNDILYLKCTNSSVQVRVYNSSTTIIGIMDGTAISSSTGWTAILLSLDLFDYTACHIQVNDSGSTLTSNFSDETIPFNSVDGGVFGVEQTTSASPHYHSNIYFTTEFIDFSDESNRLKFVDALGYPVDLRQAIENEDVPTPLIYLQLDDQAYIGKNLGTGGDFTEVGTVPQSEDFNL